MPGCTLNACGENITEYFENIQFQHKRIQRYKDRRSFCTDNCIKCLDCVPDISKYTKTSCSTVKYSSDICVDLFREWLNVPEPAVQVKICFTARDSDGYVHLLWWEGNIDKNGNVCFTYGKPQTPWYIQYDGLRVINTYCKPGFGCAGPCYPHVCDCNSDEQHFVIDDT